MNTLTYPPKPVLDDKAITRLKQINVQLNALQVQIHEVVETYHHHIRQAAKESGLPLDNIQIEAELDFCLKPGNPQNDPTLAQSDTRVLMRRLSRMRLSGSLNYDLNEPGSVIGSQGWLFHDLTEHAYGTEQPQVTPTELLELDAVHVELVIRHPVLFKQHLLAPQEN